MRPRIFIGSSREHLKIAEAVQSNLERDFETTVWNQDVIRPSTYVLESLFDQLGRSDFGVFALAPDDIVISRNRRSAIPRDNVIFEMGLFAGRLGRERVFFLVPRGSLKLHLPSDLMGLHAAEYDIDRNDDNLRAALATACSQIARQIRTQASVFPPWLDEIVKIGLFPEFVDDFPALIQKANSISVSFIHSRRWRENNDPYLRSYLLKGRSLEIYLPDLTKNDLIASLKVRFDDGPNTIPNLIIDALAYFDSLSRLKGAKVTLKGFAKLPSYSFYQFDNEVIMALYPNAMRRKPVPTIWAKLQGRFGDFFKSDKEDLEREARLIRGREIQRLLTESRTTH